MAVKLYDEALLHLIKSWIKDPNVWVLSPNDFSSFIELQESKQNDKPLTLPLVCLSRTNDITILTNGNVPLARSGKKAEVISDTGKVKLLDAIPINLSYQLDIFTRYSDEGDEYMRNFVFNFMNHPSFYIMIPYNGINYKHVANIDLDTTIQLNSNVPQKLVQGQFTRWTISFNINDAFLWSVPVRKLKQLIVPDLDEDIDYDNTKQVKFYSEDDTVTTE